MILDLLQQWLTLIKSTGNEYALLVILPIIYVSYKIFDKTILLTIRKIIIHKLMNILITIDNHPLLYMKSKYLIEITNLNLGEKERNIIFKIILETMLDFIINKAKIITKKSNNELVKLDYFNGTNNLIVSYEKEILKKLKQRYNKKTGEIVDGELIYNMVYLNNVKAYNQNLINMMLSIIDSNGKSNLSTESKVYSLFNTIVAVLDATFYGIEKTFYMLNGELSNILDKYK